MGPFSIGDIMSKKKSNLCWKNEIKDYCLDDLCIPTPIVTRLPMPLDATEDYYIQKERTMYAQSIAVTPVIQQETYDPLKYILYRLEVIFDNKVDELKKEFRVSAPSPTSIKQLKEWLAEKNYHVRGPYKDEEECWAGSYFHWGKEPDEEGYKVARDKLRDAYHSVIDVVKIKTDEDARLKALQDFQSQTFH